MRLRFLLLVVGLFGSTSLVIAEPLDQPTVTVTLKIERERGGESSEIHAGVAGSQPSLAMSDIRHGWATASCKDKLLILGKGVVEDQGQVLFTEQNRAIDLVKLVDFAVRARWPGHEHLHLQFGVASCEGDSVVLPVTGSHLQAKAGGSAIGFRGAINVRSLSD